MPTKTSRNRTIILTDEERRRYAARLLTLSEPAALPDIRDRTICQDTFAALDYLPAESVDLVFADPPYNLTKAFHHHTFKSRSLDDYEEWLESWIPRLLPRLKPTASVYICGDWRSSAAIHRVMARYLIIRNRITWQREKGRGSKRNWKNTSEDIWFGTLSDEYVFNVEAVKLKRRVLAPYTDQEGKPKDWEESEKGRYRLTHPANIWFDITVPFWSMAENTDHPTQKPEKLLARIILAGSNPGQLVFDPFLGSGTTSVVAKKLGRHYIGVEADEYYCCLAEKRLHMAEENPRIQGYADGVFWERNTFHVQR